MLDITLKKSAFITKQAYDSLQKYQQKDYCWVKSNLAVYYHYHKLLSGHDYIHRDYLIYLYKQIPKYYTGEYNDYTQQHNKLR